MINNKYILGLALIMASIFGIAWTFNHVNPWVGFIVGFAVILLFNQLVINKKTKKQNEKN
jgi:hypothetical protein